jgi:hypothetical protein
MENEETTTDETERDQVAQAYDDLILTRVGYCAEMIAAMGLDRSIATRLGVAQALIREGRSERSRAQTMVGRELAIQEAERKNISQEIRIRLNACFNSALGSYVEKWSALVRFDQELMSDPFRSGDWGMSGRGGMGPMPLPDDDGSM